MRRVRPAGRGEARRWRLAGVRWSARPWTASRAVPLPELAEPHGRVRAKAQVGAWFDHMERRRRRERRGPTAHRRTGRPAEIDVHRGPCRRLSHRRVETPGAVSLRQREVLSVHRVDQPQTPQIGAGELPFARTQPISAIDRPQLLKLLPIMGEHRAEQHVVPARQRLLANPQQHLGLANAFLAA